MAIFKVRFSNQVYSEYEVEVEADSIIEAHSKAYNDNFYSDPVPIIENYVLKQVFSNNSNPINNINNPINTSSI